MAQQGEAVAAAPAVSVVMAVYNGSATVARAIGSVRAQTLSDWELLVVDDASTDGSADLVAGLAEADPRIRLLRSPSNSGGPARPRNAGLREARGGVVCLLDQDDLWHPDKLALQVAKHATGDFGLVYSDAVVERPGEDDALYSALWGPMAEGHVSQELLETCFVPALTAAVPAAVVAETGLFDESLSGVDDYDYWLRISLSGKAIGYVDQPLATWSVGSGSLSHRHAQQLERLVACLSKNARPEFQDLVDRRVAATEERLWRLQLHDYAHHGGLRLILSRAETAQQRKDVLRATVIRLSDVRLVSVLRAGWRARKRGR